MAYAKAARILTSEISDLLDAWLRAAGTPVAATLGETFTGYCLALDAIEFVHVTDQYLKRARNDGDPHLFSIAYDFVTRLEELALGTGDWAWARRNAETYISTANNNGDNSDPN